MFGLRVCERSDSNNGSNVGQIAMKGPSYKFYSKRSTDLNNVPECGAY